MDKKKVTEYREGCIGVTGFRYRYTGKGFYTPPRGGLQPLPQLCGVHTPGFGRF